MNVTKQDGKAYSTKKKKKIIKGLDLVPRCGTVRLPRDHGLCCSHADKKIF